MAQAPTDTDSYIAAAPPPFRPALQALRAAIRAHLQARGLAHEECLSYAMPGIRLIRARGKGPVVAGFAAHKAHCSFYPHSGTVLPALAAAIGPRGHTRSALHFTPEDPIPADLLAAALDLRLAEAGA